MVNMDEWRASLAEYRIAWITAFSSIALILLVSTWPELFTIKPDQARSEKRETASQAEHLRQPAPEKPPVPVTVEQAIEEKAIEQAPPKVIDAQKTPATVQKEQRTRATKPKAMASATPASGYYVQTGAFKDAAGAEAIAGKLGRHGWPAIVVPRAGLFAVWAGPRQSRDAIEKLQQEIQRGLNIKGFIVQKKPA